MPVPLIVKTLVADKIVQTIAEALAQGGGRLPATRAVTAGGGAPLPIGKLIAVPKAMSSAALPAAGLRFSPDRSCIALQIPASVIYKVVAKYLDVISSQEPVSAAALAESADKIRKARRAQSQAYEYDATNKPTKDII